MKTTTKVDCFKPPAVLFFLLFFDCAVNENIIFTANLSSYVCSKFPKISALSGHLTMSADSSCLYFQFSLMAIDFIEGFVKVKKKHH